MKVPAVLRERNFRLLFVGQMVTSFGDRITPVALAFAILDLTGRASDVGFVLAAETIPMILFFLVGGVWGDRISRVKVMIGSDIVRAVVQALIAVLLITGTAQVWHLVILAAIYGTAQAFFFPAFHGMPPLLVESDDLQDANALLGLSRNLTSVFGPAVAGLIVAVFSPGVAIGLDAITFVVSVFFLLAMNVPARARTAEVENFLEELKHGWKEFTSHTWLWVVVVHASFYLLTALPAMMVLGPYLSDLHYGGAPAWAAISTGFGVGAMLGGFFAMAYKPKRILLVAQLLLFLEAPRLILFGALAPLWTIVATSVLSGAAMSSFGAFWSTTLQQHIPERSLSRVSSYDFIGSFAFSPIGYALVGPIAEAVGARDVFFYAAGYVIVSTALTLLLPDIRNLRRKSSEVELFPEPTPALER